MARDRDDDRFDDEFDETAGPLTAARLKRAKDRVKAPAIILIVHAVLGLLGTVYNVVYLAMDPVAQFKKQRDEAENNPQLRAEQKKMMKEIYDIMQPGIDVLPTLLPVMIGLGVIVETLTLIGAVSLLKLSSSGMAKLGSALAIIPCFGGCCLIGIGGGIWAFSAMRDPDVKAAFAAGGKLPTVTDTE